MTESKNIKEIFTEKSWNISCDRKIFYDLKKSNDIFNPENSAILTGGKCNSGKRFVVVDQYIYDKYEKEISNFFHKREIEAKIISLKTGEKNKTMDNFTNILHNLNNFQIDRRGEPIIAIGGGVTTDLAGFVASVYRRGVPHIKVPTTLMGYVDASVGIKTGINFGNGKNRVGTFEPPISVILDKCFLKTLNQRQIINGVGEILKLGVVNNLRIFELLEEKGVKAIQDKFQNADDILDISISVMVDELEPNLYENNLTRSVDFGHTFSPALEIDKIDTLLHGEAVAIDIAFSTILAKKRGLIKQSEEKRVFDLMKQLNLPYYCQNISPDLMWDSIKERTYHRDGLQRIPLPSPLGQCTFRDDLNKKEVADACLLIKAYATNN